MNNASHVAATGETVERRHKETEICGSSQK
jgi:hypothetical protein